MSKNPNVIPCSYRNCHRSESTHFAFDGYGISEDRLGDEAKLQKILASLDLACFDKTTTTDLINIDEAHTFDPLDHGLLGYIVGPNGYFVCRTSLYYKTLFADLYIGKDCQFDGVAGHLMKLYAPRTTSRCRDRTPSGKYGRHVVYRRHLPMEFLSATDLASNIVHKLRLRQNGEKLELNHAEGIYNVFVPLVEGYLTIVSSLDEVILSLFSRQYFDAAVPRRMFAAEECYSIQRGSNLEISRGPILTPELLATHVTRPTMWQGGTVQGKNRAAILGAPTGGG